MANKKCTVLVNTSEISHDEWLEYRRQGIGGSDAGPISGKSKWASPYSVWIDKTGRSTSTFEGNHATELGSHLERPIAELYARKANARVVAIPVLLQSTEHPHMLANVDFFILGDDAPEIYQAGEVTDLPRSLSYDDAVPYITAILEIKTGGLATRGDHRGWDNDNVPINYLLQGVHYSAVTGINKLVYAALLGGQGLTVREIDVKQRDIDWIMEKEQKFWQQVQSDTPPEPAETDLELIREQYATSEPGTVIEADDFLAGTIDEYRDAKIEADLAEQRVKALRAKIELALAGNEAIQYQGETLLTYKSNKSGEAIDTKTLIADHPELAAKYKIVKPGARVLRLTSK
jgi:putative phage-type endonuclease